MSGWVVWLAMVGCKSDGTSGELPTGVVEADLGYDARPANPACVAPSERLVEAAEIDFERVYAGVSLTAPLGMFMAPGDSEHWFVIEQAGRVKRFARSNPATEVVLDITGPVQSGGEMGLLGLAFHPEFASNGRAFVHYTAPGPVSHLAEIQTSDGGATWDAGSMTTVLSVDQPYANHNGGSIEFGPDGMLYWALGDGGSAGDPGNRAQDLGSLLGKILRIDVNTAPYAVPPDNPFVDTPGAAPEVYAYGLRNPWRMSFDRVTGELWTGDVGQDEIEEVDRIEAGGNYGWKIKEGNACYAVQNCDGGGLIDPVVDYFQNPGFSVMGGVVYRGSAIPNLVGTYLFSDYYHGRIVGIVYNDDGEARRARLVDTNRAVVAFAEDEAGEVFFVDHQAGSMYQIVPVDGGQQPDFPTTLSATGCVQSGDVTAFADGVIPYEMNHGFWSDGADKRRGMAIPDGTSLGIEADGDLSFPVGTVLVKEFTVNGQRAETRLFMRHNEEEWAGYSYRWRADGSDADLVRSSENVDAGGVDWEIPGREACMQCHTDAAGRSLGLEVSQLTGTADYPTGRRAPQLATLAHIGWIDEEPVEPEAFVSLDDAGADLETRARTYLHVNCSMCHRPGGPGRGEMDLRFSTPLAETELCAPAEHGDFEGLAPNVVTAGDPDASVLIRRVRDLGAYRMPPIASHVVDEDGAALLDSWISSLTSCP